MSDTSYPTINIYVKDCKYFLAYPEGLPYSHELGDCDFLADTCSPHGKCPINTYLKKPHKIIEDYEPVYDSSPTTKTGEKDE